jgi:hypothetical protein
MDITPWLGVNVARFGELRFILRERLGDFSSFRREPDGPLIDHYVEAGLLLSFNTDDRLDFMEIVKPADGVYSGVTLVGRPFGEVISELHRNDVDFDLNDSGCSLREKGISLYTPAPDEPDVSVEGVAVFSALERSSRNLSDPEAQSDTPGGTLF